MTDHIGKSTEFPSDILDTLETRHIHLNIQAAVTFMEKCI